MPDPSPAAPVALLASRSAVKWLTVLALAGLALGVVAGILVARWDPPGATAAVAIADALVRAWTNAFRLLVVPLVVTQVYLAIAGNRGTNLGTLGLSIPVVFGGLLALTAGLAVVVTVLLLPLPWFAGIALAPAAEPVTMAAAASGSAAWVDRFIPPNLFAAATTDNILPLMLVSLVFAIAMRGADAELGETVNRLCRAGSHAAFTLVGWLLRLTPLVMLALGFRSAVDSGAAVGEVILAFAGLEIVVVLVAILLLYVVARLVAGVPLGRFARAVWPAQLTAIATRSSLATLPALLTGATALGLRSESAAAVLPTAGATLKLSRAITGPVKLLFLAHVLGITITPDRLLVFAITVILLSATTVGVPTVTSGNRALPAYVAAGVPAEYVVLLSVAVSLTDIFLTALNSTGYMVSAALVDRFGIRASAPAVAPATGMATDSAHGAV